MRPLVASPLQAVALAFVACAAFPPAARAEDAADPHAHHRALLQKLKRATRTSADYALPKVELVREDGKRVSLTDELADGRPVVLNFIFTTCASICPVMSGTFSQLQTKLGADREKVHMVSISIDPEQDTPSRLAAYATRFKAGPQWRFYTGTSGASQAVQRAFDAWRGDKMAHTPATFLRAAQGGRWVRIDGFASSDELATEVRSLVAAR